MSGPDVCEHGNDASQPCAECGSSRLEAAEQGTPAAPAPLRELLISVLNDCEREFDARHDDYGNADIADWLLARGVRVSGANEETPK